MGLSFHKAAAELGHLGRSRSPPVRCRRGPGLALSARLPNGSGRTRPLHLNASHDILDQAWERADISPIPQRNLRESQLGAMAVAGGGTGTPRLRQERMEISGAIESLES